VDDSHPFLKCVNDNFLFQHVQDPTRRNNILDLVFTSEENMIKNLVVGENFGTSDHQIIRWNMLACKELQRDIKSYNYTKVNYDIMRHEIALLTWDNIIIVENVEDDWFQFKAVIEKIRNELVPCKTAKIKISKWVTRMVTKCRRAKNKAWANYKESGKTLAAFEKYRL